MSKNKVTAQAIPVEQGERTFLLTRLPARVITSISYAAVRGLDNEKGAVQRVLNARRIASVRDFTLQGGDFPSALVLNWASSSKLAFDDGVLSFTPAERSAQIIDGQHRIAGIEAAIEERATIGDLQLPVAIYASLTTQECADIFLSINTEQKTVSRSLVFDLFGIASDALVDHVAVRARDVAMFLHESEDSPYNGQIKLPGSPRRRGGIALSTVVSAIKPLVEDKGSFELYGLVELEVQKRVFLNLFRALHGKYGARWDDLSNVFLFAAGFSAAVRFLQVKLLPYCSEEGDFSEDYIAEALNIDQGTFVSQGDLRGLSGGDSISQVYDALVEAFAQDEVDPNRQIKL